MRVLLLGGSFSGEDLSRDLSPNIKEGYLVSKNPFFINPGKASIGEKENVHRKASCTIEELRNDGSVLLTNGDVVDNIDVVLLCTGY